MTLFLPLLSIFISTRSSLAPSLLHLSSLISRTLKLFSFWELWCLDFLIIFILAHCFGRWIWDLFALGNVDFEDSQILFLIFSIGLFDVLNDILGQYTSIRMNVIARNDHQTGEICSELLHTLLNYYRSSTSSKANVLMFWSNRNAVPCQIQLCALFECLHLEPC